MAGLIPQDKLEQIRAASDIVDIIGGYLPLKRAGANFVTLCPFHHEKTPSFNVNPQRQIFHCFGCHKGGDVFTFVQEYESIDFVESVKRLAERASIPLEFVQDPGQQRLRSLKDTLWQIHEQITQRWQTALLNDAAGQIARDYLKKRAVSQEAVSAFRLGYAPEAWDDTVNWAKSKGFDLATVEQAGLILRKEQSGHFYDRFRGRLIFPICDEQGRVIAFSGRILTDEKVAKYVNSPETPIFTKGKVFYGLDKSKRPILDAGFAVICEGQLDLISCYMAGLRNILAPQGTAFTADHARILKRYTDEVVLCFDSDTAGNEAAVRVFDTLLAAGLAVRVASLPAPHDPDSFIKECGPEHFQALIKGAQGFFDFLLNRLCAAQPIQTDKGRMAVVRAMAEAVQKTGSAVLADTHAQKTAQRLGVSPESVRQEFRKIPRIAPASGPNDEPGDAPGEPPIDPPERELWILRFLLSTDEIPFMEWVATHLDPQWITQPLVREFITARLAAHRDRTWAGPSSLLDRYPEGPERSLLTSALARPVAHEIVAVQTANALLLLRNQFIEQELQRLTREVNQPDLPHERFVVIEREKNRLRALKVQPLGPMPSV